MASLLTHKDISRLLGVSETTVKSYRRKFPGCIPVANEGKPIRFKPEAAEVCTRIRDFFETGMAVPEIRRRLAAEFPWIEPEAPREEASPQPDASLAPAKAAPASRPENEPDRSGAASFASLAKSMVGLSLEHSSILRRLEKVENSACGAEAQTRWNAVFERLERLEAGIAGLARAFEKFAVKAAADAARQSPSSESREGDVEAPAPDDLPADAQPFETPETGRREIFYEGSQGKAEKGKTDKKFQRWSELPFLAQNENGQYVNLGHPRFCINDLRAVLADRIQAPSRYALSCYETEEETWLVLSLSGPHRNTVWRLLLVPAVTSNRKHNVLVAERAIRDENEVPTALFHNFINELIG